MPRKQPLKDRKQNPFRTQKLQKIVQDEQRFHNTCGEVKTNGKIKEKRTLD